MKHIMQNLMLNAIFLIFFCALSTVSGAQNVNKCGTTYSQTPCPDGQVLDVTDKRTSAQKAQTDLATGRDARTADAMEKARLQQEKMDLAANTPPTKSAIAATATNTPSPQAKKKKRTGPEYLTAQVSGKKKKKQIQKKNVEKKSKEKL